jgi:Secretion system C-terminal sorting domain
MGGEITWECSGNNYVFTLKFYRDCRGVSFSNTTQQIEVAGHPTISSINCMPFSLIDLSTPNCGYSCADVNPPQGATEEYVFKSAPISLGNFTPPASGWIFTWSLCCRNSTILNLTGPGGLAMTLRSKMFSYNGQLAMPCFDNSPAFAERPSSLFCTGNAFTYSNSATDFEFDSLRYTWDKPADGFGAALILLNYANGYTVNSQMPGTPTLDQNNGLVGLSPDTTNLLQGDFITCIRVDAFKCNVKVAEIYREMQVGLTNACPPVFGGGLNNPPVIKDINNIPLTLYSDTVYAGDTLSVSFAVGDLNYNTSPFSLQQVTLISTGLQFGINDTGTTGCLYPPCATLNHPSPFQFTGATIFNFNWVTGCDHVISINGCSQSQTFHQFALHAFDNYCPAPGRNSGLISINVKGPEITASGSSLSCPFPNGTLQWYLDSVLIPGATANTIQATSSGIYTVVALLSTGCSISSPRFPFNLVDINNSLSSKFNVIIIPNPSSGFFELAFESTIELSGFLHVEDVSGRAVLVQDINAQVGKNNLPLDFSGFDKGVYLLRIQFGDFSFNRKILIN